MKSVELQNPDIRLTGPEDMPECGELTAMIARNEHGRQYFVSFWKPTREEITALVRGGSFTLTIAGPEHPPVALGVLDREGRLIDG